jgi:hypothetical protein
LALGLHLIPAPLQPAGWLRDSSHVARRIGTMDQYLVCSPDFVAALKGVREPEDLGKLAFVATGVRVLPEWKLPSGGIHVVLPSFRFRSAKGCSLQKRSTCSNLLDDGAL